MVAVTNLVMMSLAFAAVSLYPARACKIPNQYWDEDEGQCLPCTTCFTGWIIVAPCSGNSDSVCGRVTHSPTVATHSPTAATHSPTAATHFPTAATHIITLSPTPQIPSPTSTHHGPTLLPFRLSVSPSPSTTALTGAAATSTEGTGGGLLYFIIGGGVIGVVLLVGLFVGIFRWYRARSGSMDIQSPSKTNDLESGKHGSDPKPVPSKGTPDEVLEIRNQKHDDDGKAIETDYFQVKVVQSNVTPELSRDGSQRSASSTATTSTGETLATATDCDSGGSPARNTVGGSSPMAAANTARPPSVTHSTPLASQAPAGSSDPPIMVYGNHFGNIINFNFNGRVSSDDQPRARSPTCIDRRETDTCQGEQVVGGSHQPVDSVRSVTSIPQQDTNPPTQVEEVNSAPDS